MSGAQGRSKRPVLVPVPADIALAYDGKGWRLIAAPPPWWTAEREQELTADAATSREGVKTGSGDWRQQMQ